MQVINTLNYIAVNYGSAILASGLLSPLISAVLKAVERFKWTNNDLLRTLFALSVFILAAGYHALMTSHSLDRHVVLVQGMAMFIFAQPFFYLLVRPGFRLIADIWAKSKAYDAQVKALNNEPTVTKPAYTAAAPVASFDGN